jgi:hypothetical protein
MNRLLIAAAVALGAAALSPAARAEDAPKAAATPSTATAIVEDSFGLTLRVTEPSIYRPSSGLSLGGGGKGAKLKEIRVWYGAHEILVPLERVTKIEVFEPCDQDLLRVRLTLSGGGQKQLEGKIERDLELRGRVEAGQYQIKFERVKTVNLRG